MLADEPRPSSVRRSIAQLAVGGLRKTHAVWTLDPASAATHSRNAFRTASSSNRPWRYVRERSRAPHSSRQADGRRPRHRELASGRRESRTPTRFRRLPRAAASQLRRPERWCVRAVSPIRTQPRPGGGRFRRPFPRLRSLEGGVRDPLAEHLVAPQRPTTGPSNDRRRSANPDAYSACRSSTVFFVPGSRPRPRRPSSGSSLPGGSIDVPPRSSASLDGPERRPPRRPARPRSPRGPSHSRVAGVEERRS